MNDAAVLDTQAPDDVLSSEEAQEERYRRMGHDGVLWCALNTVRPLHYLLGPFSAGYWGDGIATFDSLTPEGAGLLRNVADIGEAAARALFDMEGRGVPENPYEAALRQASRVSRLVAVVARLTVNNYYSGAGGPENVTEALDLLVDLVDGSYHGLQDAVEQEGNRKPTAEEIAEAREAMEGAHA